MAIDTIIFDFCGTLVDEIPPPDTDAMYASMANALGIPTAEFRRLWRETGPVRRTGGFESEAAALEEIARLAGATSFDVAEAAHIHLTTAAAQYVPRPDAVATLADLRGRGLKLGLISNCAPVVPLIWRVSPMADLFEVAIFSCEVGFRKPDPRIFEIAVERLGTAAERCVYVGDGGSRELTAATARAMTAVCIRAPHEEPPDDTRIDAREWTGPTISTLGELVGVPGLLR